MALRLKLPLTVASQSLRAMEARGLLAATRAGLQVTYRIGTSASSPVQGLVAALM